MSAIQRTVKEAEAELKNLYVYRDSLNRDLTDNKQLLDRAKRERDSRNRETREQGKRAVPGLQDLVTYLSENLALIQTQINELEKFTSLSAEAERAIKLVQANTTAASVAELNNTERRALTNQSLQILAAAERVKNDRVISTDADRLKEQLRIEQEKAAIIMRDILDAAGQERRRKEAEAAALAENSKIAEHLKKEQELMKKQTEVKTRIEELAEQFDAKTLTELQEKMKVRFESEAEALQDALIEEEEVGIKRNTVFKGNEDNLLNSFFSSLTGLGKGIGEALGNLGNLDFSGFAEAFRIANDVSVEDLIEAQKTAMQAALLMRNDPDIKRLQEVLSVR